MPGNVTKNGVIYSSFLASQELRISLFTLIIALSVFGVVANIVNMITFWKLRRDDPINLNLLGLSLSDFFVCLTSLVCFLATGYWYLDMIFIHLKIIPLDVIYMTVGIPHSVSVRVTVLLTTSIAFQRCICVIMPFKVKRLFTRSRVTMSVVISFVLPTLMVMIPVYYVNRLQWVTIPGLNMTVLRNVMTKEFYQVNVWSTPINTMVLLVLPFTTVSICSVIMIKQLKKTINWRLDAAEAGNNFSKNLASQSPQQPPLPPKKEIIVQKEKRIIKLVLVVCSVFLFSYAPNIALAMSVAFTSDFNIIKADDMDQLIGFIAMFLDTFNSSINVFIYYHYSTNYRTALKGLFCHK